MGGEGDVAPDGAGVRWEPVTGPELEALALAADPATAPDEDAVPVGEYLGLPSGLLPPWYMPRPTAVAGPWWRTAVVLGVVAAFLVLEAVGLCSTFGPVGLG